MNKEKCAAALDKESFAEYMRKSFNELALSQKDLSRYLSVDERTVRGYLNGEHKSDAIIQQKIREYIDSFQKRDIGDFYYIDDDDFHFLLEYLDKKLKLSDSLPQTKMAELLGISQGEYSKNWFYRNYSIYEQYDILNRIYERIYAGEQCGRKLYTAKAEVIGREIYETLNGRFTFKGGRFISFAAIKEANGFSERLPYMPENIRQAIIRLYQNTSRNFDYPFNMGIFYMIRETGQDYYISRIDEIMKLRSGFNSDDKTLVAKISDMFLNNATQKWVEESISEFLQFVGKKKTLLLEYFREHEDIRNQVINDVYEMLGKSSRYVEASAIDEFKRYSREGNAKYIVFTNRLSEFKDFPIKIQNVILDNIGAFCPQKGKKEAVKYVTTRFIKKYRLLDNEDKDMIKSRLEGMETVGIATSDFDVVADCRAMVKLAPMLSGFWKRDVSKKAEEKTAENYREFCRHAQVYTESLINIMAAITEKLSFTSDEWYIWTLVENAVRVGNGGIINYLLNTMEGDFPDENEISDEELEKYSTWQK